MSRIHIALASDARYLRHAAAATLSVLEVDPSVTVHLLHDPDVPDEDLGRFADMVTAGGGVARLHRIEDPRLESLATMGRIGTVMWYRLLLPSLLTDVERALYLDADTFVVSSLRPLFELHMEGHGIAAVSNVLEPAARDRVARLGIRGDRPYFNSGVLLLDLDVLRTTAGMDEVIAVARQRAPQLAWPDQDALNLVLGIDRVALEPRWNVQNSLFFWREWAEEVFGPQDVRAAIRDPAVLHFEGPGVAKPWHRDCAHPWRDAYRQLAGRTPWGPLDLQRDPWRRRLRGALRRRARGT